MGKGDDTGYESLASLRGFHGYIGTCWFPPLCGCGAAGFFKKFYAFLALLVKVEGVGFAVLLLPRCSVQLFVNGYISLALWMAVYFV